MRIAAAVPTFATTLAPVAPKAGPTVAPSDQEVQLIERMDADNTIKHIAELNKTPRVWKSVEYDKATEYVMSQLREAGWEVHLEELQSSGWGGGGRLRNVVAERRGTAPDGERKLVIAGAHLDSVRGAPGANDNASGSSTLIELAKSFSGIDTRNDIRLVWFDGEEAGLLGSKAHAKAHPEDMARAVGMINMDMVGSKFGTVGFSLGPKTSNALGDAMKGVLLRTGLVAEHHSERHSRSDHAAFDAAGVPSLDFGVSIKNLNREDPYYHSPKDSLDKINPDVLEGYGDLIAVTVLELANQAERAGAKRPVFG